MMHPILLHPSLMHCTASLLDPCCSAALAARRYHCNGGAFAVAFIIAGSPSSEAVRASARGFAEAPEGKGARRG